MDKICIFALLVAAAVPLHIGAQKPQSPLDEYLETAKSIVIAKCLAVGPVNILLQADVDVQVLHVVKGKETLRNISVRSEYQMIPGRLYLLRTTNEASATRNYFHIDSVDSAILMLTHTPIEELRKLPARTLILGTMNLRVHDLESEIRSLSYELEAIKKALQEN